MKEVTKTGLRLLNMPSVDNILRYPCPLCIPTLMKRHPANSSWYDYLLSLYPSTKNFVPHQYLTSSIKISDHRAVNSTALSMFRLLDSIPLTELPNFTVQKPTKNIATTKIFTLKEWLSKGEIIAKMGSNKAGTLRHLKTKAPVGYFVCEDPFKR